mmetsp:Transcript_43628/g.48884  ORF Transcript_43628/g.48884 Transcript_43628/m.48884 type:complete len:740 (+) Transcript_43628:282-2501(+)
MGRFLFSSLLLLMMVLFLTSTPTPTAAAEKVEVCPSTSKKLVVFVGPHRSAASSVEDFFMKYARGRQPGGAHGKTYHALGNIRWPLVYGEYSNDTYIEEPYKRFNLLLSSYIDQKLRTEIMNAIKRDWQLGGVSTLFMGGEAFDEVTPFFTVSEGDLDSIKVIQQIVDFLDIPSLDCVTILLNYRLSRFDHWLSIYNEFQSRTTTTRGGGDTTTYTNTDTGTDVTTGGGESAASMRSYEQHICSENEDDKLLRFNELGTSMNPMYLSEQFLSAGYNVKMIDMTGIPEKSGTDISHVIGCEILQGRCEESGWVKGHVEESIQNNVIANTEWDVGSADALEQKVIEDAETVFLYRDCAYEQELVANPKFQLILQTHIWEQCAETNDDTMQDIYHSLRHGMVEGGTVVEGNQLLFDALVSQLDCDTINGLDETQKKAKEKQQEQLNKKNKSIVVSMEDVLSGKHLADMKKKGGWFGGHAAAPKATPVPKATPEATANTESSTESNTESNTNTNTTGIDTTITNVMSSIVNVASDAPGWMTITVGSVLMFVLLCCCCCCCRKKKKKESKYGGVSSRDHGMEMVGTNRSSSSRQQQRPKYNDKKRRNRTKRKPVIPMETYNEASSEEDDDYEDEYDRKSFTTPTRTTRNNNQTTSLSFQANQPMSLQEEQSKEPIEKGSGRMQGLLSRFRGGKKTTESSSKLIPSNGYSDDVHDDDDDYDDDDDDEYEDDDSDNDDEGGEGDVI